MASKKNVKKDKQTEEQKLLVEKVLTMYKKAYTYKEPKHKEWDEAFKAYSGEGFLDDRLSYMSNQLSNYVFSTIETVKPIMLAENPKIIALPRKEEHYDKAEIVGEALSYEWDRTKMFRKLHSALTVGLVSGNFVTSLIWDGAANEIKPLFLNPFNCFADPMATSVEDAEYFIYAAYKNVGEVIEFAPDKEEELRKSVIAPSDEWLSYGQDQSQMPADTTILYIEAYFRDYSTELEDIEEDGVKKKVKKRKYPNGRRVILAGDVLLKDGENPYEDGKFPFIIWKCYENPGQLWGFGEVKNIVSPQKYTALLTNHVLDSARLTSNPVWIIDKNAGIKKNSLTNRDGLVIRKNPGSEVKRDVPPTMPAYVTNMIDMLKRDVEHVSGVFDVTRGERPTGITAAAAIQALTEQAQGRIRLKIQSLEGFLAELGSMWISRIKQFWVTSRTVRVLKDDYSADFLDIGQDEVDGDWDIIISAGSTMAVNKTARLQQLIQLAQTQAEDGLPMIDRQTLLENTELADVKAILKRFEAIKEEQRMNMQQGNIDELALQDAMNQLQLEQEGQMQEGIPEEDMQSDMPAPEFMEQAEQMIAEQEAQESGDEEQPYDEDVMEALMQVIQLINEADPEELLELAENNPEVLQILQLIAQIEQPDMGLEGEIV